MPAIDIKKTCQAAAGVMVSLMGGTTAEQDVNTCLDSEQKARDQIVKDLATYSSADKTQCMRTDVYLPSYVEWLTCLEMERDVRTMTRETQFGAGPYTLPKVNPAPAFWRSPQSGRRPRFQQQVEASCRPAQSLVPMSCSRVSALAAWGRSIAPATPAWCVMLR